MSCVRSAGDDGGSGAARAVKLSIIIPVYNEEQTIHEVIERVWAVDLGAIENEVIIANDGSSDGTRKRSTRASGSTIRASRSTTARSILAKAPRCGSA